MFKEICPQALSLSHVLLGFNSLLISQNLAISQLLLYLSRKAVRQHISEVKFIPADLPPEFPVSTDSLHLQVDVVVVVVEGVEWIIPLQKLSNSVIVVEEVVWSSSLFYF